MAVSRAEKATELAELEAAFKQADTAVLVTYRGVAQWDRDAALPLAGRLAGAISLSGWIVIVAYGRWTAYYNE